jgi:hypothetical protein
LAPGEKFATASRRSAEHLRFLKVTGTQGIQAIVQPVAQRAVACVVAKRWARWARVQPMTQPQLREQPPDHHGRCDFIVRHATASHQPAFMLGVQFGPRQNRFLNARHGVNEIVQMNDLTQAETRVALADAPQVDDDAVAIDAVSSSGFEGCGEKGAS